MSERASLRLERRALGGPTGNARRNWSGRESVIVRLGDEMIGLGEAAPIPGHSRETIDEAHAELRALGDRVLVSEALLDQVATASARFALESALLDHLARKQGIPLYAMLGEPPSAPLSVAAVVSGPPDGWLAESQRLWALGYRTLKIKLGPAELDRARDLFAMLRRNMPGLQLRLDFNQSLPRELLRGLASFEVELIEEPTDPANLLPGDGPDAFGSNVWALDESMAARTDWRTLVGEGRYRVAVLKPSVIGGLRRSIALAAEARALGATVVFSYGWEGAIGWAAACNAALAGGAQRAAGLAPHSGIDGSLLVSGGLLHPHARSGLGLGL